MPTLAFGFSLSGSDSPQHDAPTALSLEAEHIEYSREQERVIARGNVVITRLGATLTVDRLIWHRADGRIHAEGNVRVVDGKNHLNAAALDWDLNQNIGDITDGELTLEGRYHLSGGLISRLSADHYRVEDGVFSTCPCRMDGAKDWSVSASDIRVRAGGNMVARKVAFRVRGVPVMYLPVFLFPTSPRQTGLLIPSFGSGTRDGIRIEQPFYWDINPSQDLTLAYHLRSKLGNGGALSYRYMTGPKSQGELRVEGLNNRQTGNLQGEANWRHDSLAETGWRWHADVNLIADRDHLRETEENTEQRTLESLESNLFAHRQGKHDSLAVLLRKTTNLVGSDSTTVQQLPRVRGESFLRRAGPFPAWYGGHLDVANLTRRDGDSAARVDAAPNVLLRVSPLQGRFTASAQLGARWIWYSGGPADQGGAMTEAYPMEATLSGRLLGRLFGQRHLLVPQLRYRLVEVNQSNTADFDLLDRVQREHELSLAVKQRLGRVSWRFAGAYNLADRAPLPLRSEWNSHLGTSVWQLDTLHKPQTGRLERLVADAALVRGWGQLSLGALFDRGTVGVGTPFSGDTLLAAADGEMANFQSLGLLLGPWAGWSFNQRTFYDWDDGILAEARYGLAYGSDCWSLALNYVDLPDRNLFTFRLALIGPEPEQSPLSHEAHALLGGA
jgi:LPS-assembly protein